MDHVEDGQHRSPAVRASDVKVMPPRSSATRLDIGAAVRAAVVDGSVSCLSVIIASSDSELVNYGS